jgi:hypothetical protein
MHQTCPWPSYEPKLAKPSHLHNINNYSVVFAIGLSVN